jgi:hypothetical protein
MEQSRHGIKTSTVLKDINWKKRPIFYTSSIPKLNIDRRYHRIFTSFHYSALNKAGTRSWTIELNKKRYLRKLSINIGSRGSTIHKCQHFDLQILNEATKHCKALTRFYFKPILSMKFSKGIKTLKRCLTSIHNLNLLVVDSHEFVPANKYSQLGPIVKSISYHKSSKRVLVYFEKNYKLAIEPSSNNNGLFKGLFEAQKHFNELELFHLKA